jgi:hypothetical protein
MNVQFSDDEIIHHLDVLSNHIYEIDAMRVHYLVMMTDFSTSTKSLIDIETMKNSYRNTINTLFTSRIALFQFIHQCGVELVIQILNRIEFNKENSSIYDRMMGLMNINQNDLFHFHANL